VNFRNSKEKGRSGGLDEQRNTVRTVVFSRGPSARMGIAVTGGQGSSFARGLIKEKIFYRIETRKKLKKATPAETGDVGRRTDLIRQPFGKGSPDGIVMHEIRREKRRMSRISAPNNSTV